MKYRLNDKGRGESAKRSLQRKLYYSVEDKIFAILKGGVGYSADSIYSTIEGDRTIKASATLGDIKNILSKLIKEKYIEQLEESPIQADETIKGGGNRWQFPN